MAGIWVAMRTGDWLTASRIRGYSLIVLGLGLAMLGWLVATSDGLSDYAARPLGTDFSNVYAAGKWVLEGRPEAPFSPALQHEMEKRIFGTGTPFYGWHYPPVFLGVVALLAMMPYLLALFAWQAATLALYLWVMRAILPMPGAWLPALAFPAVLINISHGHNGFLSAALLGGGLVLLDRRPQLAGVLFGLLVYKPQFGAMIPVALAGGRRWRTFVAAALTVIALVLLSWLAFGGGAWVAFRDSLEFTRTVVLEQGGTGFHKIQSPFAAFRLIGAPVVVAYAAQGAAICTVAVLLFILWRSEIAFALKAAALLIGALIATPYVLDYDLMVMAPAIAFFAAHGLKHGFHDYEKSVLAFCWIAPLLSRLLAEYIHLPVGLIALILLFGIILRRAAVDRAALSPSSPRV
jgi:alpha-1,2-mannosyltransferase